MRLKVLGIDTWVSTPEDVVLSKLLWRVQTQSEVQWRDCVEVAATQKLDVTYLRLWAAQLDISADIEKLLEATRR